MRRIHPRHLVRRARPAASATMCLLRGAREQDTNDSHPQGRTELEPQSVPECDSQCGLLRPSDRLRRGRGRSIDELRRASERAVHFRRRSATGVRLLRELRNQDAQLRQACQARRRLWSNPLPGRGMLSVKGQRDDRNETRFYPRVESWGRVSADDSRRCDHAAALSQVRLLHRLDGKDLTTTCPTASLSTSRT